MRQKKWPVGSACHAGLLGDDRTPVGFVRLLVEYNMKLHIIFYFCFMMRSMLLMDSAHSPNISCGVPKDMVDNSTSRFQTHFGPVSRDEAVQRDLLFPEPGSIRGFLRVSSPVSP